MKITMIENDGCFAFRMESETLQDAALLARYSNNVTAEVRSASAAAYKDGTFIGHCVLGKRKNASDEIARAR